MASPAEVNLFTHVGPWTEEDFFALPEDRRIELLDGELLVSPPARTPHQRLSRHLANALDAAAPERFEVLEAINVRAAPGRILIPDIAVITTPGIDTVSSDAGDVALVVEIVSPGSVATDRAVKPALYATAGIGCYLRVEAGEPGPAGFVYGLRGDRYLEDAHAGPGEVLRLREPFSVEVDLAALARRV
jgi:Uma2 family endonuclease